MADYIKALYGLYVPENTKGQGMVEYGLILVLISIAAIALMGPLGTAIGNVFSSVTGSLGIGGGGGTGS